MNYHGHETINSLFWKALQSLPSSPNPLHIKIVSLTTPPTPRNTKSFGYVPFKIHEILEVKSTSSMVLLMSGGYPFKIITWSEMKKKMVPNLIKYGL